MCCASSPYSLQQTAKYRSMACREFDGAWESLIYDTNIKDRLVKHAQTSLHFSSFGVDSNISGPLTPFLLSLPCDPPLLIAWLL
jgi:hypothetical protein